MYHLMVKEPSILGAKAADKVCRGFNQLQRYVSAEDSRGLKEAYEIFRSVRSEMPSFDEAYLYEGIALDLMERHDEAISRFHYLAEHTSDQNLREKALYNEAVSRFRKYRPDELETAIKTLGGLAGKSPSEENLAKAPISALAFAAEANAIAHRPIFWQRLLFNGTKSDEKPEILRRKEKSKKEVKGWTSEVEKITEVLERVSRAVEQDDKIWDEMGRRQLRWAIQNARGNAYLNYAMNYLGPPQLAAEGEPELQKECFQKAYSAFQECEMLLPPGVETLTNLATVLLQLSKTAEARSYSQRAIDLNRDYEYAYYRLAQCWQKEDLKDKVVEVLQSFQQTPRIPEFKKLYEAYKVKSMGE
jgi:tetratricopeptide (TPR) repeat protein